MSKNTSTKKRQTAGLGDIRVIIGGLMGIYGVILTIMGIVMTDASANLWAGIALLVVCGALLLWNALDPTTLVDEGESITGGPVTDKKN